MFETLQKSSKCQRRLSVNRQTYGSDRQKYLLQVEINNLKMLVKMVDYRELIFSAM